tara:strand:- start:44 stop:1210 length:1167 start_codon:yes stop_codon:yes gene_type:complete
VKQERGLGMNVLEAALDRIRSLYENGDKVVVCFSGGKDSTCILELALIVAKEFDALPLSVVMRDDEIMFPGTFEYCERVAARDDIDFHWVYANQPVLNVFNREMPYYWAFDPQLSPEEWVRIPPDFAYHIPVQNITYCGGEAMFPPADGQRLVNILGLRVAESPFRRMGLHSSGSFLTKKMPGNKHLARPIYDWKSKDVWKFLTDFKVDYNVAYHTMARVFIRRNELRIAPPFMSMQGLVNLKKAQQAWPKWFDKCAKRVGGIRSAAMFGKRAVTPQRQSGELWSDCFQRLCIDDAPKWIAERAEKVRIAAQDIHSRHSPTPFPENKHCPMCRQTNSWRSLTLIMYGGDPFCSKVGHIGTVKAGTRVDIIEPDFFREGAGKWGGPATW